MKKFIGFIMAALLLFAVGVASSTGASASVPAATSAASSALLPSGGSGNFYVTRVCGIGSSSAAGIHRGYLRNSTPAGAYVNLQEYRWYGMRSSWLYKPHSVTRNGVSVGTSGTWRVYNRTKYTWVFKWRSVIGTYASCTIYQ